MPTFDYQELPIAGARSMAWYDDGLVDWLGSQVYGLDGTRDSIGINFGFRFDSVVQSNCRKYTVLYENLGTKGVVLQEGRCLREINRSFYCAESYDFPINLFTLSDGRAAIAHCPDEYNRLEIDLLETGERLTRRSQGEERPADFFHSGLAVDAAGSWLMSAGWVWHPYYEVSLYSIAETLGDPSLLDGGGEGVRHRGEIASATFLATDLAVMACDPGALDFEADGDSDGGLPGMLGVYRPSSKSWESCVVLDEPAGKLLAVDENHVLALYKHPKLINVLSGQVVARWPQIDSGVWKGCISAAKNSPPIAWDPILKRLAVASRDKIKILILARS